MLNPKSLISYRAMVCKLRSLRANWDPTNAGVLVSLAKVVSPNTFRGTATTMLKMLTLKLQRKFLLSSIIKSKMTQMLNSFLGMMTLLLSLFLGQTHGC